MAYIVVACTIGCQYSGCPYDHGPYSYGPYSYGAPYKLYAPCYILRVVLPVFKDVIDGPNMAYIVI